MSWICPECSREFSRKTGGHIRIHNDFVPWNKGLTKEVHPGIKSMSEKQSSSRAGKPTGRITFSRTTTANYDEINKERSRKIGLMSREHWKNLDYRAKVLDRNKSEWSEESRQKAREWMNERRALHPEVFAKGAIVGGKIGGLVPKEQTPARIDGQKRAGEKLKLFRGPLASNWQGGKSFQKYGENWTVELKAEVRERDNYQCADCGLEESSLIGFHRKLLVHHLDEDKHHNELNNLVTLCISCHQKRHRNRLMVI